jgi:hypothetical protein
MLTSFSDEASFQYQHTLSIPTLLDFAPTFDARTVRASDSDKQSLLSAGKLQLAGKVCAPLLAPTTGECTLAHAMPSIYAVDGFLRERTGQGSFGHAGTIGPNDDSLMFWPNL